MKYDKYFLAVISHLRSQNVPDITKKIGEATWFVGKGEGKEYQHASRGVVIESGGLVDSRNSALEMAWHHNLPCVIVEDDLKKVSIVHSKTVSTEIKFHDAVKLMLDRLNQSPLKLCGVAPTANLFFFNPSKRVSINKFCVGSLIVVKPCKLKFDLQFRLKEDYDYTLQHIQEYGGALRCNDIIAEFKHYGNPGGAVSYRTEALEQETIRKLKAKWGGAIRDNPRRPNEILLHI